MRLTGSGRFVLAFLIAAALCWSNVPAQAQVILPGNPSTATPLAPTTIIQNTAIPALPPSLEQEARSEIAALRGIPDDTLNDYWSRGEIRAYMLLRALKVGNEQVSQYGPGDAAIASYFNVFVYEENQEIFQTALTLFNNFEKNPCTFRLPGGIGNDNGQDYLNEDGVTTFCNTPPPPPIFGTFVYVPVPPASQFWSWAQAIVINKHLHDWGSELFSNYADLYAPPTGIVEVINAGGGFTTYDPSSLTSAGAAEYVGSLQEMDEGVAFLVSQFTQIPATNPSPAQMTLDNAAGVDLEMDLIDHGVREIISSDITTASKQVLSWSELADLQALGEDTSEELGAVVIEGAETGVGPILIAGAITGLNILQGIEDGTVANDLVQMGNCALYSDCTSTPKTISDYAKDTNGGQAMMLQAVLRATMPSFYLPRYNDPAYGTPPKLGPIFPSDQTFLVNGVPAKTFQYKDWNGNVFTASAAYGWFARQAVSPPANFPSGPVYSSAIGYLAPSTSSANGEEWYAWLDDYAFYAQRAGVFVGYGFVEACPGGVIGPNGSSFSTGVCLQIQPVVPVQAGDQISVGGQVNSVSSVSQSQGLTYIDPTYAVPSNPGALSVFLLAHPDNTCLTSSSLDINGSPRSGVNGPDCVMGSMGINTTISGAVSVVQPTAEASFDLSSLTEYYGDPPFSVATIPYWSSVSNGAVTFQSSSTACSVTSDGTVTITGLGTCTIKATQAATPIYKAPSPITRSFSISAGQPAMAIFAPAILLGNSAVITVAVEGLGGGTATGKVSLSVDSSLVGTQALSGGLVSFTLTNPSLGSHSLSASFSGSPASDFLDNSANGTLTVEPNFGTVTVGAAPPHVQVTYTFSAATLLSAVNILTEGAPGLDYTDYGGSTCQAGKSFTQGQSCVVNVQFSPTAAGARPGAVTLFANGSTTPLFTAYLNGIAKGPAITIDPGAETVIGLTSASGVATDGAGNIYVVYPGLVSKRIVGQNPQTVAAGLPSPKAVALDGAGNVYISDTANHNVIMVPNENGTLNSADKSVVIQGIGTPAGLATDVNGNLDVADNTNGIVWQVPTGTGSAIALLSGLNGPQAVAVDGNLNLYVATDDNAVTEYPAGYTPGGNIQPIAMGNGYLHPEAVAVDASGTVYVADTGNNQIVAVAPGGASQSTLPIGGTQFGSFFSGTIAIALDSANSLYLADPSAGLVKVNRTQAAPLVFSAANNTDSASQTATVTDAGNQQLNIISYSITGSFTTVPASTGTNCTEGGHIAVGKACQFPIVFSPTGGTGSSGTLTVNSNAPGSSATASISLTGLIVASQTITFTTSPPATTTNTSGGAFNVAATASSGLPVIFSSAGVCTNFGSLYEMTGTTGTCSVIASQAGNANYAPVSVTLVTNVLNSSFVYWTSLPAVTVLTNTNFTASATGVSQQPISFSTSGPCVYDSETNSGAVYTGTFTMNGIAGICTITANQSAGGGFVGSSINATVAPVSFQTITFTQNAPASATYGQSFTVAATASSGLPVTFSAAGACTNTGATFTMTGSSGTCWVTANQAGNGSYLAATSVTETTSAQPAPSVNFGNVNAGTTSSQTITYTFTSAATLSAVNVLTDGVTGHDYSSGSSTTCKTGVAYTVGEHCKIHVSFKPSAAGVRAGAVTLFAQGTNLPLLTAYLSGIGDAGEMVIDPGRKSRFGTLGTPRGSALDGAGNVYVADYANNQVVRIAANGKTESAVVTGLSNPNWVALDGAGNLYISQSGSTGMNGALFMVPNENGALNPADMVTLSYPGLTTPFGLALDVSGNLYVADYSAGTINLLPSGGGTTGTAILSGLTTPTGVAVDSQGNLYVSSYAGNTVSEYFAGGFQAGADDSVQVGSGYNGPEGIAVDAVGNVYVADFGNRSIKLVSNPDPQWPLDTIPQTTLVADLNGPYAVAVNPMGNLVISDQGNVDYLNRTTGVSVTFPPTSLFGSSPPQTLTLTNVGTSEIDDMSGAFTPEFQTDILNNFNILYPGQQISGSVTLVPGDGPESIGPVTGILQFVDTAVTGGGTQTVSLSGTEVFPNSITFTTSAPASAVVNQKFQVAAYAYGAPKVTFTSAGVCKNTHAVLQAGGSYLSTYTMTSGTGTCTVIASVPEIPAPTWYGADSATQVVVASQKKQGITFPQPANQPLSEGTYELTAMASSGLPVSFISTTPKVCTVSGNVATLLTTGTCTIRAVQPGNSNYAVAAPVIRSCSVQ